MKDTIDELDYRIVSALQVSPRADWRLIGQVVDVSASTVARRWERMTEAGLAWLGCHPMRLPGLSPLVGVIEVNCAPTNLYSVAYEIANDPHVFGVSHLTGSRDLLVTAVFDDHSAMTRYVAFRLHALDGVATTRSEIATAVHTDGGRWRQERLGPEQRTLLRARDRAPSVAPADPDPTDLAIMTALGHDVRQPLTELAHRTNLSPTTVQRRLARLEVDRLLTYRCEVARFLSGWPLSVTIWACMPPGTVGQLAAPLIGMREIRFCASVTGPHNVILVAWLRSLADVEEFEARLTARIPGLSIADRAVTLRTIKLGGQLLDPYGRQIRSIPIALWAGHQAAKIEAQLLDGLYDT